MRTWAATGTRVRVGTSELPPPLWWGLSAPANPVKRSFSHAHPVVFHPRSVHDSAAGDDPRFSLFMGVIGFAVMLTAALLYAFAILVRLWRRPAAEVKPPGGSKPIPSLAVPTMPGTDRKYLFGDN